MRVTWALEELAKKYDGEYDGWETGGGETLIRTSRADVSICRDIQMVRSLCLIRGASGSVDCAQLAAGMPSITEHEKISLAVK